jgi:hypothetical protein
MSVSYGGDSIVFADGSIVASGSQGFKNKIINGAMMIDQRNAGASLTITTNAQYSLDRWKSYMTQASKFSVRQMESSNTAASNYESSSAPTGFTNSIKVTSASAYSVLTGDYFTIGQNIEGYNIADLDWGKATAKTVTLSFWVKSSLIGTFGAALGNNAGSRGYPFSYTINVANTWEYKTVTITGDTTGTWETGIYNGIVLYISLGTGATYSGTAGAWTGSFLTSATGATSIVGTSGATFYLSGVQLEKGTTASSFEFRSYGKELMLCQRYYQKSFGPAVVPANNTDSGRAILAIGGRMQVADVIGMRTGQISFINPLRVSPTITLYNSQSATGTAQFYTETGSSQDSTTFGPVVSNESGFCGWQYTGVTVGTTGTLCQVLFHYTASAEL